MSTSKHANPSELQSLLAQATAQIVAANLAAIGKTSLAGCSLYLPDTQPPDPSSTQLARMIDHTLLRPEATRAEIARVCEEARAHHFAAVCVNSVHIAAAAQALRGSDVKPISVVGFPLGAMAASAVAFEASEAVRSGAQEIDMVIDIGALKEGALARAFDTIRAVVAASGTAPVKVILETSMLTDLQKTLGCLLSKIAGAAFVKTSTGMGGGGATPADIRLMRAVVGPELGVKASGGIRTREDAIQMIRAGANRIGASASIVICAQSSPEQSGVSGSGREGY